MSDEFKLIYDVGSGNCNVELPGKKRKPINKFPLVTKKELDEKGFQLSDLPGIPSETIKFLANPGNTIICFIHMGRLI